MPLNMGHLWNFFTYKERSSILDVVISTKISAPGMHMGKLALVPIFKIHEALNLQSDNLELAHKVYIQQLKVHEDLYKMEMQAQLGGAHLQSGALAKAQQQAPLGATPQQWNPTGRTSPGHKHSLSPSPTFNPAGPSTDVCRALKNRLVEAIITVTDQLIDNQETDGVPDADDHD